MSNYDCPPDCECGGPLKLDKECPRCGHEHYLPRLMSYVACEKCDCSLRAGNALAMLQSNPERNDSGSRCAFCDAGKPHAWHDDGSYNTDHAEFLDDWVPSQNPPERKREGDPRFLALLDEIEELHARKQRDYGTSIDPFANVRASEDWGIAPYLGALIRLSDKIKRLQTYAKTGKLANEGVEDSLMDISVYALISLILFREQQLHAPAHTPRRAIEAH